MRRHRVGECHDRGGRRRNHEEGRVAITEGGGAMNRGTMHASASSRRARSGLEEAESSRRMAARRGIPRVLLGC
jgi:hypothetical protein